jgi:hypothetical protein
LTVRRWLKNGFAVVRRFLTPSLPGLQPLFFSGFAVKEARCKLKKPGPKGPALQAGFEGPEGPCSFRLGGPCSLSGLNYASDGVLLSHPSSTRRSKDGAPRVCGWDEKRLGWAAGRSIPRMESCSPTLRAHDARRMGHPGFVAGMGKGVGRATRRLHLGLFPSAPSGSRGGAPGPRERIHRMGQKAPVSHAGAF